jgi:hypothetical protein
MDSLTSILKDICTAIPETIGVIMCDQEGEKVVGVGGTATLPQGATDRARSQLPASMQSEISSRDFVLRIVGAEPCALLRLLDERGQTSGAGRVDGFDLRYSELDLLVQRLPDDYYVVLALRRPSVIAVARDALNRAAQTIGAELF